MADLGKKPTGGFGKSNAKPSFWKRKQSASGQTSPRDRPVFGAQHPPLQESLVPSTSPNQLSPNPVDRKRKKSKSGMTFDEYSHHVDDAWGCEEDEEAMRPSAPSACRSSLPLVLSKSINIPLTSVSTRTGGEASSYSATNSEPSSPRSLTPFVHQEVAPAAMSGRRLSTVSVHDVSRIKKFEKLIEAQKTPLDELSKLSWSGIPHPLRHTVWQLLSGYLPVNSERRKNTLERKRQEYWNYVKQYYHTREQPQHESTFHQITIDIPRMLPQSLFSQKESQACFQRLLYIWSMRHPASGYVQGINDLAVPYFLVFLGSHLDPSQIVERVDFSSLDQSILEEAEADTFWCLSKLLDGIHDNYTFSQPGIQQKIHKLKELVKRIDGPLYQHLEFNSIEFLTFSFRWMNNLLVRELPLQCIVRLWDTYMCERDGFASFHPYVCAAFLAHWSKELLAKTDFQALMLYLQKLPTDSWTEREINEILAAAWRWKYSFSDAPKHLH